MKNPKKFLPIAALLTLFSFSACEKAYLTSKQVEITTPVSFSADLIPIFNESCATPNCHVNGGAPPNLMASDAYDQLTQLGYVDTSNAEESILYKLMTSTSNPMPPNGLLPAEEIAYVLAWIEQGAQNN